MRRYSRLAGALLLALAGVPAKAEWIVPEVRQHGDWSVACDNALSCTAVSASAAYGARVRASDPGDLATPLLWVRREGGPFAPVRVFVDLAVWGERRSVGLLTLHVFHDGDPERLGRAYRLIEREPGYYELDTRDLAAFLVESRESDRAATRRADGTQHGLITTAGMVAALRYIDERQQRRGTVTAIYARGGTPARAIPAAPSRERIAVMRGGAPVTASTAEAAALSERYGYLCGTQTESRVLAWQAWVLADGHRLWAAQCELDGENPLTIWALTDRFGTQVDFKLPRPEQGRAPEDPALPNSQFDPATGQLTALYRAGRHGDCGWQRRWAWTGREFAMIDAVEMPACIGIVMPQWLQTYRAVPW